MPGLFKVQRPFLWWKGMALCVCVALGLSASACSQLGGVGEDGLFSMVADPDSEPSPEISASLGHNNSPDMPVPTSYGPLPSHVHIAWEDIAAEEQRTLKTVVGASRYLGQAGDALSDAFTALPKDSQQRVRNQYFALFRKADVNLLAAEPLVLYRSSEKGAQAPDGLYFDLVTYRYHLPEGRALNQQELEQILSWEGKQVVTETHMRRGELQALPTYIKDSQALDDAQRYIAAGFGVDLRDYVYTMRLRQTNQGICWEVMFLQAAGEDTTIQDAFLARDAYYVVLIDAQSGQFRRGGREVWHKEARQKEEAAEVNIAYTSLKELRNDAFWPADARELIEDAIQAPEPIREIRIQRFDGDNQLIVKAIMQDDSCYRLYYAVLERIAVKVVFDEPVALPLPVEEEPAPSGEPLPTKGLDAEKMADPQQPQASSPEPLLEDPDPTNPDSAADKIPQAEMQTPAEEPEQTPPAP